MSGMSRTKFAWLSAAWITGILAALAFACILVTFWLVPDDLGLTDTANVLNKFRYSRIFAVALVILLPVFYASVTRANRSNLPANL